MPNNERNQGRTGLRQINQDLADNALNLGPAALQMAAGAKATTVASNLLKDAVLDKLLGPTALFATGMVGVLATIRSIVKESGILERSIQNIARTQQIEGKFETLLKSATLAKQRIQELYKFTAASPFKFEDIAEGNRLLQALSQGALAGAKGMKLVGDAAAATGQQFSEVADKVGKVYNALSSGRSLDRTIFQLQLSGVVTDELAHKLETLEQRGAGFAEKWGEVEKALKRTEGGMQNEMKTLEALGTRLEEAGKIAEKAFGKAFVPLQTKTLETSIKATENLTPVLARLGDDLAPLLQFGSQFKNSIAESTLATEGFAAALLKAWEAGKVLFAAVAAATVGKGLSTLGPAISGASRFVGGVRSSAGARVAEARLDGGGFAEGTAKFSEARKAFEGDSYAVAAALAAEGVAAKTTTGLMILHKTAIEASSKATGIMVPITYAAAAATQTLGVAAGVARKALTAVFASVKSSTVALLTNPFTASLLAIGAATAGLLSWKKAVEEADAELENLSKTIADTNKMLLDQAKGADTTEKWTKSVNDLSEALITAQENLEKLQAARAGNSTFLGGITNTFTGTQNKQDAAIQMQRDQITRIQNLRSNQIGNIGRTGLNDREQERFRNQLDQAMQIRDEVFSQQMSTADGPKALGLLQDRIKLLKEEAAIGDRINKERETFDRSDAGQSVVKLDTLLRDAQGAEAAAMRQAAAAGISAADLTDPKALLARLNATKGTTVTAAGNQGGGFVSTGPTSAELEKQRTAVTAITKALADQEMITESISKVRNASGSEYIRVSQRIADLQKRTDIDATTKGKQLVALQQEQLRLEQLAATAGQKSLEVVRLTGEERERINDERIKEIELRWEERIAQARLAGLEAAGMEITKNTELLMEQLKQAEAMGNKQAVRQIKIQLSTTTADQNKADRSINDTVAADRARLAGDENQLTAIEDAARLRSRVAEFAGAGRSVGEAVEAEKLRIAADAAEEARRNPIGVDANDPRGVIKAQEERDTRAAAVRARQASLDEVVASENLLSTPVAVDPATAAFNARRSAYFGSLTRKAADAVGAESATNGEASAAAVGQQQVTELQTANTTLKEIKSALSTGLRVK